MKRIYLFIFYTETIYDDCLRDMACELPSLPQLDRWKINPTEHPLHAQASNLFDFMVI